MKKVTKLYFIFYSLPQISYERKYFLPVLKFALMMIFSSYDFAKKCIFPFDYDDSSL